MNDKSAEQLHALRDTRQASREPREIYGHTAGSRHLSLANGGAGATGLLQALAQDYLQRHALDGHIAWYQEISRNGLVQLQNRVVDVALVYEAEQIQDAVHAGFAEPATLVFYDHFLLVGPKTHSIGITMNDDVGNAFRKIAQAKAPFLSRNDHSATHQKECAIWSRVQNVLPCLENGWYQIQSLFPQEALLHADKHAQFLLTDHGTWLATRKALRTMHIYCRGGTELLNPCSAVIHKDASPEARRFLAYLTTHSAQQLIADYGKETHGHPYFTAADQPDFPLGMPE